MAKEKVSADIQIRVSKETLEKLEAKGNYSDKTPGGIISRIVDEHSEMQKSCASVLPKKEEIVEKPEEQSTDEPEKKPEEKVEEVEKTD